MATDQKNLSEVAKGLGPTEIDTASVVSYLRDDILLTIWHSAQKQSLRDRIERVYEEWHPNAVFKTDEFVANSIFSLNPPAKGKVISFRLASQEVSKALGLRYLEGVDILNAIKDGGIQPTDFLFVSKETSGWSWLLNRTSRTPSNIKTGDQYDKFMAGQKYASRLPDRDVNALYDDAFGGCLLYDDPRTEELNGDSNLTRVYASMTGNIGLPIYTALPIRVKPVDRPVVSDLAEPTKTEIKKFVSEHAGVNSGQIEGLVDDLTASPDLRSRQLNRQKNSSPPESSGKATTWISRNN